MKKKKEEAPLAADATDIEFEFAKPSSDPFLESKSKRADRRKQIEAFREAHAITLGKAHAANARNTN